MAFLQDEKEIYALYTEAQKEARVWREDHKEYERLADNELIDDLDPDLPETNDGTLAASLFKLPKRIINSNLKGRIQTEDRDEAWLPELANIVWEETIIPNANSQAPFHRKWKDAVRKAAIYGSVPLITLFTKRGDYTGADFIVAHPGDVTLEAGKVSDYDSDIIFWDVYYTKLQVEDLIKQAEEEAKEKESDEESYNKWNIPALKEVLKSQMEEDRDSEDEHNQIDGKSVKRGGYRFCVVFQRGINAPFYMYHKGIKKTIREWSNPDPTGDIPVHFLYCYQDFVNPYGIGIVKLAGGTQNVLDYMRQADVLATQLGFKPPIKIKGVADDVDEDSLVYAQDARWYVGNADVERQEISNQVYSQLPNRISMYKISLNQLIPTGDTSVSSGAGDTDYSKTPAGVKFQQQNLSIDDEDFKDNTYMTYEAVAESMINTHFANMQGSDLMKLSDEQRELLAKAGLEFPVDENGEPTNELEVIWDTARANFKFEVEAESDKAKDEAKRLEGLLKVAELRASDPMFDQKLLASGKRINDGELYSSIITYITDNDKILEDVSPEDQAMQEEMAMGGQMGQEQVAQDPEAEQDQINLQAIMEQYGVDENTAMAMYEAEKQGFEPDEILEGLQRNSGEVNA